MKKVVSPAMTAHLWANQSQPEAQNSGRSLFFVDNTIYSYGSHYPIASFLKDSDFILWNDRSTTPTTNKHKELVRRALSGVQMSKLLYLPDLTDNLAAGLYRQRQSPSKTLPDVVRQCADSVVDFVSSLVNMRSEHAMVAVLQQAAFAEHSGKALLAYVNPGKAKGAKWPLPDLPDTVPADKAERALWIKSFTKSKLLVTYDTKLAEYKQGFEALKNAVAGYLECPEGCYIQPDSFSGQLTALSSKLTQARQAYKVAMGKEFAGALKRIQELKAYAKFLRPIVSKFMVEKRVEQVRATVTRILRQERRNKVLRRLSGVTFYAFDVLKAAVKDELHLGDYQGLVEKLLRKAAWVENAKGLEDLRSAVVAAQEDAAGPHQLHALSASGFANLALTGKFYQRHKNEIDALLSQIPKLVEELEARLAEKAKAEIEAWLAGQNVRTNHFPSLMARIKGNNVETTRGAVVPLEHACRLARIARRVIAAGGKSWPAGEGPIVGGFRVISIGSDGATVIGCHEFSATESLRLLGLLEACPSCADVT